MTREIPVAHFPEARYRIPHTRNCVWKQPVPQPLRARSRPAARQITRRQERESFRARGYDAKWDRYSEAYRKEHPFCGWCEQRGRLTFAKLVDHKVPISDGGEMFDPANWWGLCVPCHGRKAEMEAFARRTGQIERLPLWCDDPSERPARFSASSPSR